VEEVWYAGSPLALVFTPLSWLYGMAVSVRAAAYRSGLLPTERLPVPVIVVGNISVGGTGKTPLVVWLSHFLRKYDYRPGVIARGYRGRASQWPQQVRPDSDPVMVGDEAVLLARRCRCPVAAGPDRYASGMALIEHYNCNVIVSDDGLQHYRLERDIDIAVLDGVRRFGNKLLLPAGPLREPVSRLATADLVVSNGIAARGEFAMQCMPGELEPLRRVMKPLTLERLRARDVHAVAGIANPDRFFSLLRGRGLRVIKHAFPDHHDYREEDIVFDDGLPVIMTEKDAVKCARFAGPGHWYLPISVRMPEVFERRLIMLLERVADGQKAA
jgi:tetraacyldisaccharide 4'-kinase